MEKVISKITILLCISIFVFGVSCNSQSIVETQEFNSENRFDVPEYHVATFASPIFTATVTLPTIQNYSLDNFLEREAELFEMRHVEPVQAQRWETTPNPSNEYIAFHVCNQGCRIYVERIDISETYQLYLPSFYTHRDFSYLRWDDTYILEFRQTISPYATIHYKIDIENQVVAEITPVFYPPDS